MSLRKFSCALVTLVFCATIQAQDAGTETKADTSAPISYGFVIDNSGSFRKLLEDVIFFVDGVLNEQKPTDEAFFVRFIHSKNIKLDQELTSDVSQLRDSSENMYSEGGQTALIDAVLTAGKYLAENGKSENAARRSMLLVTDGDERASVSKPEAAIKVLRDAGIRVVAVAVSDEKVQTKVLERFTRETGGKLFVLKNKSELRTIAGEVAAALRNP